MLAAYYPPDIALYCEIARCLYRIFRGELFLFLGNSQLYFYLKQR